MTQNEKSRYNSYLEVIEDISKYKPSGFLSDRIRICTKYQRLCQSYRLNKEKFQEWEVEDLERLISMVGVKIGLEPVL